MRKNIGSTELRASIPLFYPHWLLPCFLRALPFSRNPAVYHRFSQPYAWTQVPEQLLTNITFTSGFWGYGAAPLSNLPFWSLTYECVYYVLYGLIHYTKRASLVHGSRYSSARWSINLALIYCLVDGCPALRGLQPFEAEQERHHHRCCGCSSQVVSLCILLRKQILGFLRGTDVDWRRAQATRFVSSTSLGHRLFHGATVPWFDRLSFSFFFTGTICCLILLALAVVLDKQFPEISRSAAGGVRTVADSTFTLYLLHVPVLHPGHSALPADRHAVGQRPPSHFIAVVLLSVVLRETVRSLEALATKPAAEPAAQPRSPCGELSSPSVTSPPGSRACP